MCYAEHVIISPAISYWGTPVVLVTSENEDGTINIAPMSSAWWLGHTCVLGLGADSETTKNILRGKECVLNLADESMGDIVDKLARDNGASAVDLLPSPAGHEAPPDKWTRAGLHPQPADFVKPYRIAECQVQMECKLVQATGLRSDTPDRNDTALAIEVRVLRTHVLPRLRLPGKPDKIDPEKWRPMHMSFEELHGLRDGRLTPSKPAETGGKDNGHSTESAGYKCPEDDDVRQLVEGADIDTKAQPAELEA